MAISGRVPLLVLVGIVAVWAIPAPLTVVAWVVLVAALCVADGLLAVRPSRLRVVRDLPSSVRLTDKAASRLTLSNLGGRRAVVMVRDAWPPSAGAVGERRRLAIRAGEAVRQVTTLTPSRRGDLHAADVTIRSFGPLGLVARQGSVTVEGTLRVLPEFRSRSQLPYHLARLRELDGQAAVHVRGQGTEFDSLRDYAVGDDVRSIDWRASARAQKTMVRTWRPERDRHILIVLDTSRWAAGRLAAEGVGAGVDGDRPAWARRGGRRWLGAGGSSGSSGSVPASGARGAARSGRATAAGSAAGIARVAGAVGETRLDPGIETCLLMGALGAASGDRVSLLAADRAVRARVAGASQAQTVLSTFANALSHVEPTLVEADWPLIAAQARGLCSQRSLVVLVTGLDPAVYAEGLGLVLPALAHDHRVVIAHVTNPDESRREGDVATAGDVYTAAATTRLRLATDTLAARVERMGVRIVRADPQRLAPAVCDAYLALKAAGQL